jgi:molybdopterin/thiamine biosynthesis adenylyltransferase
MNTVRNTVVFTTELYELACRAPEGSPLIVRQIGGGDHFTMLAHRLGDDAGEREMVVILGTEGLLLDERDQRVRGVVPGPSGGPLPVHAVRVIGETWRVLLAAQGATPAAVFDRQIRAFGSAGQHLLSHLRAGVVGAGGTGSAVCEQLIRLGVGEITVIDDDVINDDGSNVTRVWGSTMADIGMPKVDIVARTADRVGFGTRINAIHGTINDELTARELRHCDVVFGCTDDNRGRLTLSRLAVWYLIPVIDMGVKLSSNVGTLTHIDGRVTVVDHATGCLQCRGRIDARALQSEVLQPHEREGRVAESYAVGLAERDPAVVAYTTAIAAIAVAEFLARVFGLDDAPPSSELIVRFQQRALGRSTRRAHAGHWCADPANIGAGDIEPFLGTMWIS